MAAMKGAAERTMGPARDIDDYLAGVPEEARNALEKLRKTIRAAAPKATEGISWQMPAFRYQGLLVGFAAFKNHCSFFPMGTSVMDENKDELNQYATTKGSIHFTAAKPLPVALVRKIVKARVAENEARVRVREGKRSRVHKTSHRAGDTK